MDDLINRKEAIDIISFGKELINRALNDTDIVGIDREKYEYGLGITESYIADIEELPSAEPQIIHCKDCKWWDAKDEDGIYGYCHAIKHSHYSRHWEIQIHRTYEPSFYCADAEPKEEEEDDETD